MSTNNSILVLLHTIAIGATLCAAGSGTDRCSRVSISPSGPIIVRNLGETVKISCTVNCDCFDYVTWANSDDIPFYHIASDAIYSRLECDNETFTQNYTLSLNVTSSILSETVLCIGANRTSTEPCKSAVVELSLQTNAGSSPILPVLTNNTESLKHTVELICTVPCHTYSHVTWIQSARGSTSLSAVFKIQEPPNFDTRLDYSSDKDQCVGMNSTQTTIYKLTINVSDPTTLQILYNVSCVGNNTYFSNFVQLGDIQLNTPTELITLEPPTSQVNEIETSDTHSTLSSAAPRWQCSSVLLAMALAISLFYSK